MNSVQPSLSIIIADEHPLYRIALKEILQKTGKISAVSEVADGKELMNKLVKKRQVIAFININLPLFNFEHSCKLIKSSYPETRVVLILPGNDHYTVRKALNSGCAGFILETEGETEILEALETVRSGRRYFGNTLPDILLERRNENALKKESNLSLFSETELTILKAICFEKTNKEITDLIFRSPRTIEGYRRKIFKKANTKNAVGLIRFALRNGIITHEEI